MKQTVHRFDQTVTNWVVATFGTASRPFFEFMTMLGDPIAVGLVTAAIMITGFLQHSVRLMLAGAAIPLTVFVGFLLKLLFERARPMTEYALNMKLQTFSFPSGHSSGSMIAYGLLAYLAFMKLPAPWNVIVGALLAIVPLFVGLSRIYLGAHFPSDVMAGWALGLLALALVVFILKPLS